MKDGEIGSGLRPRIGQVEQAEEVSTWTKLDGLLREQARVMAAIKNQVSTLVGQSQDSDPTTDPATDPATDACQGPAIDAAHPRQILAYVQMAQDLLLDAREHLAEFDQEHRDQSITVAHYTAKADRLEIQNSKFRRKLRERNTEIKSINRTRKTGNLELGRARRTVEELHRYCHDLLRLGTESMSAETRAEHDHGRLNRAIAAARAKWRGEVDRAADPNAERSAAAIRDMANPGPRSGGVNRTAEPLLPGEPPHFVRNNQTKDKQLAETFIKQTLNDIAPHQTQAIATSPGRWNYSARSRNLPVVAFVCLGAPATAVQSAIDLVTCEQIGIERIAPLFIIDCKDFAPLRWHRIVFEYVPPEEERLRLAPELDWTSELLRRAGHWNRKWRPRTAVCIAPPPPGFVDQLLGAEPI